MSIPIRHPQIASRVVEGQEIILYADSGEVTVLNDVGTRVWELIDGARSVDDIIGVIAGEYVVERAIAERDVAEFLQDLARREAIIMSDTRESPLSDTRESSQKSDAGRQAQVPGE